MTNGRRQTSLVLFSETFHCIFEISTDSGPASSVDVKDSERHYFGISRELSSLWSPQSYYKIFTESQIVGQVGWEEEPSLKQTKNKPNPHSHYSRLLTRLFFFFFYGRNSVKAQLTKLSVLLLQAPMGSGCSKQGGRDKEGSRRERGRRRYGDRRSQIALRTAQLFYFPALG